MSAEAQLLTFLVNSAWQVPVLVAIGVAAQRLLGRAPARQQHALWLLVAIACTGVPLASSWRPAAAAPVVAAPSAAAVANDAEPWLPWSTTASAPVAPRLGAAAIALYVALLAWRALGGGWALRRTHRLAADAWRLPLGGRETVLVERCRRALGVGPIVLLESDHVAGPATVGWRRPVILLPSGFFEGTSEQDALAALAHEMAHVRRRDFVRALLVEAVLLPVSYHPLLRLLRRRLALTRELACDELAVAALFEPRAYARSLLALAQAIVARPARSLFTLGVADAPDLEVRMKRLLQRRPRLGTARSRLLLTLAIALVGAAAWTAALFSVSARAQGKGDLSPFVGAWSGDFIVGEGGETAPRRALDLDVSADGEIVLTWYRYEEGDGAAPKAIKEPRPATEYQIDGKTLTFTIHIPDFRVRDQPPKPTDFRHSLELESADAATFRILENSSLTAAKARGEAVPPPPPPLQMHRRAGSA